MAVALTKVFSGVATAGKVTISIQSVLPTKADEIVMVKCFVKNLALLTNDFAYGASKGGICQLTRAMAEAWSKYGICCNAIAPGFFSDRTNCPGIR
ncbi:MAG: NAD(P)-dependent dehydrogenase (short-subunit alcohol dehydrogenase family) [Gammaproteobacteria bacterium]|jgi:NAD(P)-dependent dehydrogenase (short-subunit alcohol dehydrogenase family)